MRHAIALAAVFVASMPRALHAEEPSPDPPASIGVELGDCEAGAVTEPDDLELASATRPPPIELSRHRTLRLPRRFLLVPMGHGLYCVCDAQGIETKGWTREEHHACVGVVRVLGATAAGVAIVYGSGGLSALEPGAAAIVVLVAGELGGWLGEVVGERVCPAPPEHPVEPPIGRFLQNPIGSPCLCPDAGCAYAAGCGCGCTDGASCGCCDGGGA